MAEDDKDDRPSREPYKDEASGDGEKPDREKGDEAGHGPDDQDAGEEDGPPLYKRPLFWIIGGIVAAVLIIGGVLYWLHARRFVSTDDAFCFRSTRRLAAAGRACPCRP